MKKMTKTLLLGLVVGLISTGASFDSAWARGRGHGRGGCKAEFGPRMAATLNLTAEQQAQIDELRAEMDKDLAPVHDALDKLRSQKHQLWTTENPDEGAIIAIEQKMDPLRKQIRERKIQFRLDMLEILTPEQRAEHQKMMESRKNRGPSRGDGRGPWSGKGAKSAKNAVK